MLLRLSTPVFEAIKYSGWKRGRKCSVISTNVGGLKEVIAKEENLYTKETVDRFIDRVKYYCENKEELKKDREFFFKRYKDNYTIDANVSKHIALYNHILRN